MRFEVFFVYVTLTSDIVGNFLLFSGIYLLFQRFKLLRRVLSGLTPTQHLRKKRSLPDQQDTGSTQIRSYVCIFIIKSYVQEKIRWMTRYSGSLHKKEDNYTTIDTRWVVINHFFYYDGREHSIKLHYKEIVWQQTTEKFLKAR